MASCSAVDEDVGHVQPCPIFKLNPHSFERKDGRWWEASMQADHARNARKTEDEFAETAKCACTSFSAKVIVDVAWRGLISLWETMYGLSGAGFHADSTGSAADAKSRSEGL
ncbi:MAG: hypothetical protein FRX49_02495 [Trebouxia sp. A1-2]|nr:MAG: hypothetical protein FRX49_02495 [Trebouxia sp. A1-2]